MYKNMLAISLKFFKYIRFVMHVDLLMPTSYRFQVFFEKQMQPEIVHSDITGPLQISYPSELKNLATFLDDHSE